MAEKVQRQGLDQSLLRELALVQERRVVVRVLVILTVYAGTVLFALHFRHVAVVLPIAVFLGFLLAGSFNAAHDCVHRSHLRSRRANRIAGMLWCTPILVNFTKYRYQHLVHHRFTGVPGDTEPGETYTTVGSYLRALSGLAFWPSVVRSIVKVWRGRFPASVNNEERRRDARRDNLVLCLWLVVMLSLTVAFPYALLVAYWLPLIFSFPAVMFLSLPEHYGLWGVPEVERNTRTVRSNRLVRYFLWNANYHAEHHLFPAVTSVNLHRLYQTMPVPHPIQDASYLGFHLKQLRSLSRRGPVRAAEAYPVAAGTHEREDGR